jgi:hypothetical protein
MFKFRFLQPWLPTGILVSPSETFQGDSQKTHRLVPRKFEKIESWLLMFAGAYGLLVGAVMLRAALWPMLLCGLLIGFGVVRWRWPVRSKRQWVIDALCAVALVAALFADQRTGGGAGPYLFLILILAMGFPLMLETRSALMFGGLLLLVYFAFGRSAPWSAPTALFVLRGVLIAGIGYLSNQFGKVLRQTEDHIDDLRRDPESQSYNLHGLRRYGQQALDQCQAQDRPLSLMLLPMPPQWTSEIAAVHGFMNPHPLEMLELRCQALRDMATNLQAALPSETIVGRDMQGDWVLIFSKLTSQQALKKIEGALGRPVQLLYGPPAYEQFICLMPCVVQSQPNEDIQSMYARARDIWSRGQHTGVV